MLRSAIVKFEQWERILPDRESYWLTRFVILRLLGITYAIAFLVAANQILPLLGSNGLLPLDNFIERVRTLLDGSLGGFFRLPSIFWFNHSDTALITTAWLGFALSCLVACGYANAILLALLWALYMSFVHLGQDWYGYGWETQLLETGFLAIFLCPLLDGRPFNRRPPPLIVIWLFRGSNLPNHARLRHDQDSGRRMLARFDRALLSLRNPADSEWSQPLVSFSPAGSLARRDFV